MPFKRQKKKTYKLNNKKVDQTKDILTIASNKLTIQENNNNANNLKVCEKKVTKVSKQRERKIHLQPQLLKKNIIDNCEVKNMYKDCLESIPKITISLCSKDTYRSDDDKFSYDDTESISCHCLDSSSEDDNDSDYDDFGDFKQTCSADVTTDEEMEEEIESNA